MVALSSVNPSRRPLDLHTPAGRRRLARIGARALLVVWAGFWGWFSVASALGEGLEGLPHLAFLAVLVVLVALAWWRPRIGGPVLLAGALLSAWYFDRADTRLLLSLPAALAAVGVWWASAGDRRG
jgi:hypothetical protein